MSSLPLGKGEVFMMRADGTKVLLGHITEIEYATITGPGEFSVGYRVASADSPEGIYERVCGPWGPLDPPTHEGCIGSPRTGWITENFKPEEHDRVHEACGIRWDLNDILRFLNKFTKWERNDKGTWCLLFTGAKSRGKGNKSWYGTFWCKGKSVRAHKFFAVAILGLRPRPNREDELDHHCFNTRCVSCVQVLTHAENQKRIRRRKDYGQ